VARGPVQPHSKRHFADESGPLAGDLSPGGPNDEDRARGRVGDLGGNRSQEHAGESAKAARSHDQKVRVVGGLQEHGRTRACAAAESIPSRRAARASRCSSASGTLRLNVMVTPRPFHWSAGLNQKGGVVAPTRVGPEPIWDRYSRTAGSMELVQVLARARARRSASDPTPDDLLQPGNCLPIPTGRLVDVC
jgi:hypothetical protein